MKFATTILAALLSVCSMNSVYATDLNPKASAWMSATSGWHVDIEAMGSVLKPGGGIDTLAPAGAGISVGGGYDFAASTGLVAGLYGNVGWVNVRGTATCALLNCTVGNTWEGELGGRLGLTFATMNGWLGNSTVFQNVNGKLVAPLQPITPLNQAMLYVKVGAAFQHIKVGVGADNDARTDIGLRLGGGIELPVLNQFAWRTEVDYTRFNESICGGCALPTGRPAEWGGKTGIVYRF